MTIALPLSYVSLFIYDVTHDRDDDIDCKFENSKNNQYIHCNDHVHISIDCIIIAITCTLYMIIAYAVFIAMITINVHDHCNTDSKCNHYIYCNDHVH